ncbi:hypothetical protein WDV93_20085 [Pantoea ananatis]
MLKAFALSATVAGMGFSWNAQAADTIKVGIMHSLFRHFGDFRNAALERCRPDDH